MIDRRGTRALASSCQHDRSVLISNLERRGRRDESQWYDNEKQNERYGNKVPRGLNDRECNGFDPGRGWRDLSAF